MKNGHMIITCTAAAAGVILAAVAYVGLNSFDGEPPDLTKFTHPFEVPAEADNVYCGLVATTNLISGESGLPILTDVVTKHGEAWRNFTNPTKKITAEEKDAILAESEKVLSVFHEAVQRKTWCGCDPSGKDSPFPAVSDFVNLCRLAHLEALRHLERGETGAAIEGVRDMILLARKVEHDAESAVRWLVAGGALNNADAVALRIIRSGKATDEELGRLQEVLGQFDLASRPERADRMLNNEFTLFFMRWFDKAKIDKRIPLLSAYVYHRNRTWATYAHFLEKVKAEYRSGYDKAFWDTFEKELSAAIDEYRGWRFGPNCVGWKTLETVLPAWRSIYESILKSSFQHSAVETIVAAARFKRKTGAFPNRLAELAPEFLPSVPRDPFTRDAEMRYDPARGILWTVGKDGTFNGEPVKPAANGKYGVYGKYGKENRNCVFNIDGSPAK